MSQDTEGNGWVNDWITNNIDLALFNDEEPQTRELRAVLAERRLDHVEQHMKQTGTLITFIQGEDFWTVPCTSVTHTSITMRKRVSEQLGILAKAEMDETIVCFQFQDDESQAKRKIELPHFNKFIINIIVLFWNILQLPGLGEIERVAKDNNTSAILTLVSLMEAARYFDDAALMNTALDTLRRYIKKSEFRFRDLLFALHGMFKDANQSARVLNGPKKLLFTAAIMRPKQIFQLLVLRADDDQDEAHKIWESLKEIPAFLDTWQIATLWLMNRSEHPFAVKIRPGRGD